MFGLRSLRTPSPIAHGLRAALIAIVAGSSLGLGAAPALAAQGSIQVDAPNKVELGQPIRVVLTARGVSDLAGFEAGLRFDTQAAEFGGAAQSQALLKQLGRDSEVLTANTPSGAQFALVSCSDTDCAAKTKPAKRRGANGNVVLARASIVPQREGVIDIALDHVLAVDSAGNSIAQAGGQVLHVKVGKGGPAIPAPADGGWGPKSPSAAPGPFDVTGEGRVNHGDVVEEALAWRNSREGAGACDATIDPLKDVNHNSCLDIGDLQLIAANMDPTTKTKPATAGPAPKAASGPLTFTVTSNADDADSNVGDGICRTSKGVCTLRAAIQETNNHDGADTIAFNIPGGGVQQIQLNSQLPGLWDDKTTIDGYTQPGAHPNTDAKVSNAVIRVQIRGGGINGYSALALGSSNNVIRGLAIFNSHVEIDVYGAGAHDNKFVGNFIGIDASGGGGATSVVRANGMSLSSGPSHNYVGTTDVADRNVISGAPWVGVSTYDTATAGNIVQNNIFGMNPAGTAGIPNLVHGLDINYGSADNILGGLGPNEHNVVASTHDDGIQISHNIDTPPMRNIVIGNWVGLDPYGKATSWSGNTGWGIRLEDNPQNNIVTDNIVGNNGFGGIDVEGEGANGNVVKNNKLGFDVAGNPAPNKGEGVKILYAALNNVIGPNNVIANNSIGIHVVNGRANNNTFTQNSIYSNGTGNGIQLDNGSNDGVLPPTILQASTQVVGGTTCASCTVEVFLASKPAGQAGQGKTFVGTRQADSGGAFSVAVSGVNAGDVVTATTTNRTADTSVFSTNVAATNAPPPTDYAADTFSRTASGGWGSANTGGAYSLTGPASGFAVNGSAGVMTAASGTELDAALRNAIAGDVDATFRFTTDRAATGNGQQASLIARQTVGGNMYHARVYITSNTAMSLQASSLTGWSETALSNTQPVAGLVYSPGTFYRVRVQVTGANPTTIKMKLWVDGQAEPTDWQYTATDSAAANQGSGWVGFRTYISSSATNGPVAVTYDDFRVKAP